MKKTVEGLHVKIPAKSIFTLEMAKLVYSIYLPTRMLSLLCSIVLSIATAISSNKLDGWIFPSLIYFVSLYSISFAPKYIKNIQVDLIEYCFCLDVLFQNTNNIYVSNVHCDVYVGYLLLFCSVP